MVAQVNFNDEDFQGELQFTVETHFDGSFQTKLSFSDFDDFNYFLQNYYQKNYRELFDNNDISYVELEGVSFKGRKGSERLSVNVTEGWKRGTIMFDEKKFGDTNIDKLKRIKKIIEE